MKSLIIGNGSAGQRHARVLEAMGHEVGIVSRRDPRGLFFVFGYDYAVIATETSDHHRALCDLAATGFTGKVMVEKPLFHQPTPMPKNNFAAVGIGYPLRFHPTIIEAKKWLSTRRAISVDIYCGSYLPDWRPGRDYRETYSAKRSLGGGVLRDLSHELDYAAFLFGPWTGVVAKVGKFSTLDIDSEDTAVVMASFERCPIVTIRLSYADRAERRGFSIVTDDETSHCGIDQWLNKPDVLTEKMHRDFLGGGDTCCGLTDAVETVEMIASIERCVYYFGVP